MKLFDYAINILESAIWDCYHGLCRCYRIWLCL